MAYVEAISNGGSGTTAARANAIRSGYFARNRVIVSLNGAQRSGAIKASISIRDRIGREPSTADLELRGGAGYVPDRGHRIIIGHGTLDNKLFNGRIVRAERRVTRHVETKPTYTLEATDLLFDLGRAYPANGFAAQSLSGASLVQGLLASATPSATSMGFTTTWVQPDLPTVAEFTSGPQESVVAAFDRLAEALGATWYSDAKQRIHFYTSADPEPKPSISTLSGTSPGYLSLTRQTQFSRVFSRVVGAGAAIRTLADVYSDETAIPVDSMDPLEASSMAGSNFRYIPSSQVVWAGEPRYAKFLTIGPPWNVMRPTNLFGANPKSLISNSLWVGEAVMDNGGTYYPYMGDRVWWTIDRAIVRVQSITTFSTAANSEYFRFFVPAVGPGAPPATAVGAVPGGTPIGVVEAELLLTGSPTTPRRVMPLGADVRAYYAVASGTVNNLMQSLTGSAVYGTATAALDGGLRPRDLMQACDGLLAEGHPDNWTTFALTTRDPLVQRGQQVHLSVTGPGESSGPSYTGAYTVQDVTLGNFEETADSKGPIRTATLGGSIQKPSLFDTLDRWDV